MANGLNFARRPFENERLSRLLFAAAAFVVVAATAVHAFFLTRYLLREREELDLVVEELQSDLEETEAAIAASRQTVAREQTSLADERTQFLTRIYRHKSFSWTGLFNELEAITPPDVRITSIAPFEEDGRIAVTLNVVGRTLQAVLSMVRALEGSSFFDTVFPLDEVDLAELGAGESGIAATLRLTYVAPAETTTADAELGPETETQTGEPEAVEEDP